MFLSRPLQLDAHAAVPLHSIATHEVITLAPAATLGEAAAIMAARRISSVLVIDDQGHPLGIVTERNVVRAAQAGTPVATPLQAIMSAPVVSVPHHTTCEEAYLLCRRDGIRHLALVDGQGVLTGIVSETDFRLHMNLTALAGLRLVTSVMTRSVLSLPPAARLDEAVALMETHRDSCVVVVDVRRPVGIVTERDVVRLYAQGGAAPVPELGRVMGSPLVSALLDTTVHAAANRMLEARVRHLVVVDHAGDLAGLVSEHDLTEAMALGLMDAELEAEHALLRSLIDAIPDAVQLKDAAGRWLAYNEPAARAFGLAGGDCRGRSDAELADQVTPAGREALLRCRDADAAALRLGHVTRSDEVLQSPDGDTRFLEVTRVPVFQGDGRADGLVVLSRDVTGNRRTTRALEQSLQEFNDLVSRIPVGVFKFRTTADGGQRFDYVSPVWCEMAGMTAAEAYADASAAHRRAHPEDLEDLLRCIAVAAREGTPFHWEGRQMDEQGVRWLHIAATPVPLENGDIRWEGMQYDVTARRQAEERLRLAASVFTNTQEGIVITDAAARIVETNAAFTRITGYEREEVLGRNPAVLRSGHQDRAFYDAMWQSLLRTGHWTGEVWNRRKDGMTYAELLTISAVRDEHGHVSHYVGVFADITPLKEHQRHLERIAHYDALTGVPNRVLLGDRMAQAVAQTRRGGGLMAVCYLDLDGFKAINDHHGHQVGDRVLVEMARRMKDCLRGGDTIARIGGDEFVLLLLGLNRMEECQAALERVLHAAARPLDLDGGRVVLSASVGVTLFPEDDADADALLRHADQAMYQAKAGGRNRYHLFDPAHDRHIKAHRERQQRLAQAVERGELVLHYQPKVHMTTGEVLGVEALVRWQHPERGLLQPAEFLPTAQGSELETVLGEWVLNAALAQMADWNGRGMPIAVSVNVSAEHLLQPDFAERLSALLKRHPGVSGRSLELEILESSAIADTEQASRTLAVCRQLGVRFALDDFGTGYSSLTYFRRLPVETLKIDQSFVRGMLDDPEDLGIVESVVHLAQAFKRSVIAEGAETPEHCAMLARLRCHCGQGFGIARPMPAAGLETWLGQWRETRPWEAFAAVPLPHRRRDVVLKSAIESHRSWVAGIAAYLADPAHAPVPALHARQCRFGIWYHGTGTMRYGHLADFMALEAPHEELHACAATLVGLVRKGRRAAARSRLAELEALSEVFVRHLERLIGSLGDA